MQMIYYDYAVNIKVKRNDKKSDSRLWGIKYELQFKSIINTKATMKTTVCYL